MDRIAGGPIAAQDCVLEVVEDDRGIHHFCKPDRVALQGIGRAGVRIGTGVEAVIREVAGR